MCRVALLFVRQLVCDYAGTRPESQFLTNRRNLVRVLLVLFLVGCASRPNAAPPLRPGNSELATPAGEDQAVRSGTPVTRTDEARCVRMIDLIARDSVATARDKFNAALVLQHTGLTYCDGALKSLCAENYLLAHHLFSAALADGIEDARYLVAASIDRYLSFTVGMQRYGTNRVINESTGREELVPIDRKTTDSERRRFGVTHLDSLLMQYAELPRGKPR